MERYRFVVVGSGWRAGYYIRIAKALPELFDLRAVLCRNEEKAGRIKSLYGVNAVASDEECIRERPDLVVTAVSKTVGTEVALRWLERGFTVLAETPAGLDINALERLWDAHLLGRKLVVAEQYTHYASYSSLLKVINKGLIGEVNSVNISLAHDYHGAGLIRAFLGIPVYAGFTVRGKSYEFPVAETLTRYEEFSDGRMGKSKRTVAVFEFDNGKAAFYDFDSEQYRSPIRRNSYRIQGVRGEITDGRVYYLDGENRGVEAAIVTGSESVPTGYSNPNFRVAKEIRRISLMGETLYEPPFGPCGLSEDETAVALLMKQTAEYSAGRADAPYQLREALQDAYMSILMRDAERTGEERTSRRMSWM